MESTLLHNISSKELYQLFTDLQKQITDLKLCFELKRSTELLTRNEVAEFFKCDLSTIHNWCKKGKLIPYGIGNRVYFKRHEIELSLVNLSVKKKA